MKVDQHLGNILVTVETVHVSRLNTDQNLGTSSTNKRNVGQQSARRCRGSKKTWSYTSSILAVKHIEPPLRILVVLCSTFVPDTSHRGLEFQWFSSKHDENFVHDIYLSACFSSHFAPALVVCDKFLLDSLCMFIHPFVYCTEQSDFHRTVFIYCGIFAKIRRFSRN